MATTGRFSSEDHQFPSTVLVPGGEVADQVRLMERSIRLGKFFSFASFAGTPSISTMRDETTGRSSGGAVTLGCDFSSARIPATSSLVISMRKTLGRFGAAETWSSETTACWTR